MYTKFNSSRHAIAVRRTVAALWAGLLLSGAVLLPTVAHADFADSDGDGIIDFVETGSYHTDPFNADTDGDGVRDFDEIRDLGTDPLKSDTDGDGASDGAELAAQTNPLNKAEAPAPAKPAPRLSGGDTDNDGLSDADELRHFTNVFFPDTDLDGVSDGDEVANGTNPVNVFDN